MLAFYGLKLESSDRRPHIARSPGWNDRAPQWLQPGNHNLLRLSRIIRCLALLGQGGLAEALYLALKKECEGRVSTVTLGYWKEATDADA